VLDINTGTGIVLIGVAKLLKDGTATGVDVWESINPTNRLIDKTLRTKALVEKNASLEGF
jgi:ubiquinone/menaquinone biosynthesis C-methylase UbiE